MNRIKQINNTTYKIISRDDLKDRIEIEIGDQTQDIFYPQVKLMRWDNEVNFSVRFIDDSKIGTKQEDISLMTDKLIWEKGKYKIEFQEILSPEKDDDIYKFIWYLKEKPLTNKIIFSLQSKNLDFCYQTPLTELYQNGYSNEYQTEIIVSETQVKDLEGNVLIERPENVVGSYVTYHKTKGGVNDINGKEYKTGQAFFIYRPQIIDADGMKTWGNLYINAEKGIYSIEIPQTFLDNARYPIRSNDTFGYTTTGGTTGGAGANYVNAFGIHSPTFSGSATSMSIQSANTANNNCMGIYSSVTNYPSSRLRDTANHSIAAGETTSDLDSSLDVIGGTSYWLGQQTDTSFNMTFNTGTAYSRYYIASAYTSGQITDPYPASAGVLSGYAYTVFCTYTPSGGPASVKTINGLAKASVKTINGLAMASIKTYNSLA